MDKLDVRPDPWDNRIIVSGSASERSRRRRCRHTCRGPPPAGPKGLKVLPAPRVEGGVGGVYALREIRGGLCYAAGRAPFRSLCAC